MASILAVDDSRSLRRMLKMTLEEAGHTVTEAEDGASGVAKARQQAFDLVLLDVNMPVMDGITVASRLRKLPEYASTPILMLTTESSAEKKKLGKEAGATGWIVKPFSPDKLVNVVNMLMG